MYNYLNKPIYCYIPDDLKLSLAGIHKVEPDRTKFDLIKNIGKQYDFEIYDSVCIGIYSILGCFSKKIKEQQRIIEDANSEMIDILKTLLSSKRIKFGRNEITNPTFKKWLFDGFIENFKKYLLENPNRNKEFIYEQIEKMQKGDFSDYNFIYLEKEKESYNCKYVARKILDELRGRHESDENGNWGHWEMDDDGCFIFLKDFGVYDENCYPSSTISIKEAAFIYDLLFNFGFRNDDDFEERTNTEKFDRIKRYFKDDYEDK